MRRWMILLLVMALLCCMLPVTGIQADAAAYVLEQKFDFETGGLPGTPNDFADDGFETLGDVTVAEGGVNDSGYAMQIVGAESKVHILIDGLQPNTLYRYTCYAKRTVDSGDSAVAVCGLDLSNIAFDLIATDQWQEYVCFYRTGEDETSMLMYFHSIGDSTTLVDDISVTEWNSENLMGPGWDFENVGDLTYFGTPDNSAGGDGFRVVGDVSIVSGGANGTANALQIKGTAENGINKVVNSLKPNTSYRLTFWAKANSFGENLPVLAMGNIDLSDVVFYPIYNTEWEQHTLDFTTGVNSNNLLVYAWLYSDSDIMLDELVLEEYDPASEAPEVTEATEPTEAAEATAAAEEQKETTATGGLQWWHILLAAAAAVVLGVVIGVLATPKKKKGNQDGTEQEPPAPSA